EAFVFQLQPRLATLVKQLEGDIGIAGIAFVFPVIRNLFTRDDFGDLEKMREAPTVLDFVKAGLKAYLGLEVFEGLEGPQTHFVYIRNGLPYGLYRRIERALKRKEAGIGHEFIKPAQRLLAAFDGTKFLRHAIALLGTVKYHADGHLRLLRA